MSGVPRMIQTIIFVSALIGRKAASPGELLARRENGAHLLIEPKAITSPSGSAKSSVSAKSFAAVPRPASRLMVTVQNMRILLENYLYLERPKGEPAVCRFAHGY